MSTTGVSSRQAMPPPSPPPGGNGAGSIATGPTNPSGYGRSTSGEWSRPSQAVIEQPDDSRWSTAPWTDPFSSEEVTTP